MDKAGSKIIVIIPVHNCEKYLREAVDSVLGQKYGGGVRIVLVDDGSKDGSALLCDKLALEDERIFVIHQHNAGVSAARNAGIEYALSNPAWNGEENYFAFLDADDAWCADFFNDEVVELLHKGYDLLSFTSAFCNEDMTKRSEEIHLETREFTGGAKAMKAKATPFGAMLYRMRLVECYSIRFASGLRYQEDLIFRNESLYCSKSGYEMQRLLYLYRNNSKSAVHNRPIGLEHYTPMMREWIRMDQRLACWFNQERGNSTVGEGVASYYLKEMLEEHFMYGGKIEQLKQAEKNSPDVFPDGILTKPFERRVMRMKFILHCRVKGAIWRTLRFLRWTPMGRWIMDRRRYRIRIERGQRNGFVEFFT